jgi:hypothetical protein
MMSTALIVPQGKAAPLEIGLCENCIAKLKSRGKPGEILDASKLVARVCCEICQAEFLRCERNALVARGPT